MNAWIVVVLFFVCLVFGLVALVFLDEGYEEREAARHPAPPPSSPVLDLHARVDAGARYKLDGTRLSKLPDRVAGVAPPPARPSAAKGFEKRR